MRPSSEEVGDKKIEQRISMLEVGYESLRESQAEMKSHLSDIKEELKRKSVEDGKLQTTVDQIGRSVTNVESQIQSISTRLLDAVLEDKDVDNKASEEEKAFYRKVITVCVICLVTIVSAAFGVKQVFPNGLIN